MTKTSPARSNDPGVTDLLSQLSQQISVLVGEEVRLAQLELTQKLSQAGIHVAMVAMGSIVALGGFFLLLAFLVSVLVAAGVALWLSTLLIAILTLAIGGALGLKGLRQLKTTSLAPQQTIQTLKEDVQWAKQQIR
jgi:hypothetical protein